MANLHFYNGVMGSLKTAALIANAYNLEMGGKKVEVIKPSFDKRFSESEVVSRMGGPDRQISRPALAIKDLTDYKIKPATEFLFVDEVQFFNPNDINILVDIADNKNVIVMCYGLMIDSNGHLFSASQRLVEVSAKIHDIELCCQMDGCKNKASHHIRFAKSGNIIREGEQFMLGNTNYLSVCRKCFNKIYNDIYYILPASYTQKIL